MVHARHRALQRIDLGAERGNLDALHGKFFLDDVDQLAQARVRPPLVSIPKRLVSHAGSCATEQCVNALAESCPCRLRIQLGSIRGGGAPLEIAIGIKPEGAVLHAAVEDGLAVRATLLHEQRNPAVRAIQRDRLIDY